MPVRHHGDWLAFDISRLHRNHLDREHDGREWLVHRRQQAILRIYHAHRR
jgi:hypothetical protein